MLCLSSCEDLFAVWNLDRDVSNLDDDVWNPDDDVWNLDRDDWNPDDDVWNRDRDVWNRDDDVWNLDRDVWNRDRGAIAYSAGLANVDFCYKIWFYSGRFLLQNLIL